MEKLGAEIKVRVSSGTKGELLAAAKEMGEGMGISDVARVAIGEFLRRRRSVPVAPPRTTVERAVSSARKAGRSSHPRSV